jgi:hypothetical protein
MLVSMDCWLRISEVSGLRTQHVVDGRRNPDPLHRRVTVFLPTTKTGPRQAVSVHDARVAELLVGWQRAATPGSRLFPDPPELRAAMSRALHVLAGPELGRWETRGLQFTWHSFRHGGASRAFLAGVEMNDILLRGRWAAEGSARRYVQGGRQLLLALEVPVVVAELAARVDAAGLLVLLLPDVAARLRAH